MQSFLMWSAALCMCLVTTGLQGVIKTDSCICSLNVYIQGNYWWQVLCVTHKMLKRTESQVKMDSYVISLLAANFCYQLPGAQGFQISTNMGTKRKYEEASVLAGEGYTSVTGCFDTPNIGVRREVHRSFDHVSNRESSKSSAVWKLPNTKCGQVWLMVVTLATTRHHIEVLRLYIPIPWLLRCNHFFFFLFCFILGYCSCFKKDVTSFGYDMRGRERERAELWLGDGWTDLLLGATLSSPMVGSRCRCLTPRGIYP